MEKIIEKISRYLSFVVVFCLAAFFYFNYKGFTLTEDGRLVLQEQLANAAEKNGIAIVLPKNLSINATGKFAEGSAVAPITLYEFSSLGCPHCADFHLDVVPRLEKEYVDKGLLRIIFVNFPLDKKAMQAAMVLQCATPDNYHAFLSRLFEKQRFWYLSNDTVPLHQYAGEFGISYDEVEACLHDDNMAQTIISDRQQGLKQLKMTGTPALLFSGRDGNEIIYSAASFNTLKKYLDERLAKLGFLDNK